jgi:hypothetical protein
MSDQTSPEEPAIADTDESEPPTDATPTKDQRTMFEVEDEELA